VDIGTLAQPRDRIGVPRSETSHRTRVPNVIRRSQFPRTDRHLRVRGGDPNGQSVLAKDDCVAAAVSASCYCAAESGARDPTSGTRYALFRSSICCLVSDATTSPSVTWGGFGMRVAALSRTQSCATLTDSSAPAWFS
jgi:hypothetical protein